jgi:fructose 1,6-bisphosphate aldolase/phosphatase
MRGSHNGPLMPVAQKNAHPIRFDGPPRIIALGFQIADSKLVGPMDLFDDPAYDRSRALASEIAEYMRRHGPFEPHRLPADEMEYTTLPGVLEKLEGRFKDID